MMDLFVILSQAILYVCFSILVGTFVLQIVPLQYRPAINVPSKLLLWSATLIPVATFIPVLNIILYISPRLGFAQATKIVLSTYTVGLAWTFTLLIASVLLLVLITSMQQSKITSKGVSALALLLLFALIGMVAWSSHAGAINVVLGTISDFIHLSAVSIWAGTLLIIGWYATNTSNWDTFLTWFSVLAITCLGATAVSGFLLVDVLVDEYVNAWMVNYGQGIFLKHLFIIPLVFYAAFNGLFVKYKITKEPTYNPIRGVKIESFILITIFVLTAIFSQSSPPHGHYLTQEAISPLFKIFHNTSEITANSYLKFKPSGIAIAFVFASMALFAANIVALVKRAPVWLMFIVSTCFVLCIYSTFMLSMVIR
jgi:putative copper export protein